MIRPNLFAMLTLGLLMLLFFYTIINIDLSIFSAILDLIPSPLIFVGFAYFCLFGGTVIVTAGVNGIGRQYFKNSRLFTILVAILVPIASLAPFVYFYYCGGFIATQ